MKEPLYRVRALEQGDRGFVAKNWGRSVWAAGGIEIGKDSFDHWHRALVDALLARSDVALACSTTRPSVLYGFAVGEPGYLHYTYIVQELRGRGVARELITAACGGYPDVLETSHPWPVRGRRFVLNPYRLGVAHENRASEVRLAG